MSENIARHFCNGMDINKISKHSSIAVHLLILYSIYNLNIFWTLDCLHILDILSLGTYILIWDSFNSHNVLIFNPQLHQQINIS